MTETRKKTAVITSTNADGTLNSTFHMSMLDKRAPANTSGEITADGATLCAVPKYFEENFWGWFMEARFGDVLIDAQVDTGAWVSSIPVDVAKRLGCTEVGRERSTGIQGGEGQEMPVWEGERLQGVELLGGKFRAICNFSRLRSNGLDRMILGCDFLNRFTFAGNENAILLFLRRSTTP